ncbi:hypothetical protein AB0J83_21150 [Actinoplanes sp. NPDC049596]|uniref:hypothetical protein n=1 Tax=unclassified Actinoplanes TaxID=2626549 RepID=UPI003427B554
MEIVIGTVALVVIAVLAVIAVRNVRQGFADGYHNGTRSRRRRRGVLDTLLTNNARSYDQSSVTGDSSN